MRFASYRFKSAQDYITALLRPTESLVKFFILNLVYLSWQSVTSTQASFCCKTVLKDLTTSPSEKLNAGSPIIALKKSIFFTSDKF